MTTFPETLRTIRRRYGVSQQTLARWSGVDRSYVCRLESGARHPSLSTVKAIIAALHPTDCEAARLQATAGYHTDGQVVGIPELRALQTALLTADEQVRDNVLAQIVQLTATVSTIHRRRIPDAAGTGVGR